MKQKVEVWYDYELDVLVMVRPDGTGHYTVFSQLTDNASLYAVQVSKQTLNKGLVRIGEL